MKEETVIHVLYVQPVQIHLQVRYLRPQFVYQTISITLPKREEKVSLPKRNRQSPTKCENDFKNEGIQAYADINVCTRECINKIILKR